MPFLPMDTPMDREKRREARLVRRLSQQPKAPVHNQITLIMTGTQPELEEMFADRARNHMKGEN